MLSSPPRIIRLDRLNFVVHFTPFFAFPPFTFSNIEEKGHSYAEIVKLRLPYSIISHSFQRKTLSIFIFCCITSFPSSLLALCTPFFELVKTFLRFALNLKDFPSFIPTFSLSLPVFRNPGCPIESLKNVRLRKGEEKILI